MSQFVCFVCFLAPERNEQQKQEFVYAFLPTSAFCSVFPSEQNKKHNTTTRAMKQQQQGQKHRKQKRNTPKKKQQQEKKQQNKHSSESKSGTAPWSTEPSTRATRPLQTHYTRKKRKRTQQIKKNKTL